MVLAVPRSIANSWFRNPNAINFNFKSSNFRPRESTITKIKKEVTYSNICNEEIGEMIKGLISVVDKFKDNSVSSVEIKSLKEWCKELEQCNGNEENVNRANELRKYIEELPDEIDKSKISEINKKIYQCIV